ncbi:MAG TPA: succinyldiaminopimelate transaminase [Candidatus Limnocylindrales bacterium]|nr:succinyldiaminopimelate transaminase [Candidatus Limnocylindrales bacterium]
MAADRAGTGALKRSEGLPGFPWDLLEPAKAKAAAHPGGLIDLSMGTPVDPVPGVVRRALADASDSPGYPATAGNAVLRAAISEWVERECRAAPGFGMLPTIGSKELVAWLPTLLGIGAGDVVVIPEICYPTYEVGGLLAGARVVRSDADVAGKLVWVNSPSNPTGRVLGRERLRQIVAWARSVGAVVASDECYLSLGWSGEVPSILSVCDGDYSNVLAVHSLSKRSNLAGYRAGFVAGDAELVRELLEVRKQAGMIVPEPVQAAMVAALGDEEHAAQQRERYRARREVLWAAMEKAGFTVEGSEAGLFLWVTRGRECWSEVDWFAEQGILVSAGSVYGPGGDNYVRLALTETDERVRAVIERL